MGFRFRKSKNFGPFKINLSKSGIGWSVGGKGVRFTKRADGKNQTTLNIPGTGISYVNIGGNTKNQPINTNSTYNNHNNNDNNNKNKFYTSTWFIILALILLPPLGIYLMWKNKKFNTTARVIFTVLFSIYMVAMISPDSKKETSSISTTQPSHSISGSNNEVNNSSKQAKAKADAIAAQEKLAQEQEQAKQQKKAQEQAAAEQQRIAQEQAAAEQQRIAQEQAAQQQAALQQTNTQTVWVASSGEGTKYHTNPNCSNMKDPIQISIDDAKNRGFTPCKKCY